jgi:tetratricopeptide (TPR) repeat protein
MTEIFVAGSAQQYPRANRAAEMLIRMMPNWPLAHEQNALNLWNAGRYADAIAEWKLAAILEKNIDRVHLEEQGAEAFRTGGVVAYARLRLHAIATRKGISHEEEDFIPAQWHAYAGDWDQAMTGLEKMVAQHSQEALQVAADPAYFPLHNNPRFQSLLKSIGLPSPGQSIASAKRPAIDSQSGASRL